MAISEAETRSTLIDPALYRAGWTDAQIRREVTAGGIEVVVGKPRRRARGRIDYVLRVQINSQAQPVALALIEAKKSSLPPGHGLDQAKCYAESKRLNVRFVCSSNGHMFVMYNSFTGVTTVPAPMSEFPTPSQMRAMYEKGMGFALDSPAARPLLQPYPGGESRRYYQDAAIRAVMEKVAQCEVRGEPKRALLSLATGTGKTRLAVYLLKRISDSGLPMRALFVCDRDELRTQALAALQNVFGADAAEVFRRIDGSNNAKNARVHVATYQTLGVEGEDGEASFLKTFYSANYFTHIVIDECHRSAWGKWSQVLTYNTDAVHIGLTATPRKLLVKENTTEAREDEEITANNHRYFGEPVYEYGITQATEDGYLALCEVHTGLVNLDQFGLSGAEVAERNPTDAITGALVDPKNIKGFYGKTQFEDTIALPDRVAAMCKDLFQRLLDTGGPEQKTVIFCVRDRHADDVARCMSNLYAEWCTEQDKPLLEWYAFKCTAESNGNDQLPELRGSTRSHFIATTVDLLSTGVDVPCLENVVFFKYVNSPISLYQMLGRGTRIDESTGKLMFRVYDYTNATRLLGEDFVTKPPTAGGRGRPPVDPPPPEPIISVQGIAVVVSDTGRYILASVDGRDTRVPVEEYRARLAERLIREVATLEDFRSRWVEPPSRRELLDLLVTAGYSPSALQLVDSKEEYDLFDILAEVGWGQNPRTRKDRALAFVYKNEDWLNRMPEKAAAAIRAIAGQFSLGGTDELESSQLFRTAAIRAAGGMSALRLAGDPGRLLTEAKARMFVA